MPFFLLIYPINLTNYLKVGMYGFNEATTYGAIANISCLAELIPRLPYFTFFKPRDLPFARQGFGP
ncbi:MAG: hypothetical protein COT38_04280 [Candidatus Omnitrophica bacterium CG08_land_8_20_14_0_20_41_16]|uniref:Uncharacterized protein n=1 Tax=Candidatus Sherwoodlollariibacterium unditelluris TaxID=1974757 RepID=A0A2G9YKL5_9BACT|nr:MAG: hypothetical protein COX41_04860 [Candidatus Omnitrophica bacterium CG23_combo_of_CG06-09_8_20_14_all_41_10]PIS33638.1 MAG: hypothetical protein COT38_04280 [Candidatus Omnitrophica bacterium CG08_land_8_20_14_0_20_41_16]